MVSLHPWSVLQSQSQTPSLPLRIVIVIVPSIGGFFFNSSFLKMPAEPRKPARKLTTDDDIELKRARGEISCAECRR